MASDRLKPGTARVLFFGVLKDWLGAFESTVELPQGASVAELLEAMNARLSSRPQFTNLRGIAVSVNAEYATASQILHGGDEVALLPPVSGAIQARLLRAVGTHRTTVSLGAP